MSDQNEVKANNFVRQILAEDVAAGRNGGRVHTRFPPEPNGFLHIGHAKSICLNFGIAQEFGGQCNLRFDDTNPEKENQTYIDAIKEDIRWLGFEWAEEHYASDYFEQLCDWAIALIESGKAYVCELNAEQMREYRGTLKEPGKNSPYRDRSVTENLDLFAKMRSGEFDEGAAVLRAKIDMANGNINLRDPIIYRIRKISHHQTGDKWCIYPTYDFTHGQSDAIEGITHSICTLEFEAHRPLYEWFLDNLPVSAKPRQYEFSRLNLNYTVTSKRKLKQLVDENHVSNWDDPRMPTISGMRRRGYTPAAMRQFCEMIGVTRSEGIVDLGMLEHAIRDDLNRNAVRAMCVINPLKVTLSNYDEGKLEWLSAPGHPDRDDLPARSLPFTRELVIDADDFRPEANKKYKRLVLGKRVRLRNAYVIEATDFKTDDDGNVLEVIAKIIPNTLGENPEDGIKPKGVIQWVSASHGAKATVRKYDRLFNDPAPDSGDKEFLDFINPDSMSVFENCFIEPAAAQSHAEQNFQFEREGYFVADRFDHSAEQPTFNMTIGLRDTWDKTGV